MLRPQFESISSTYGDLCRVAPSLRDKIEPHVWDNKTPAEQRDWVIAEYERLAAILALTHEEREKEIKDYLLMLMKIVANCGLEMGIAQLDGAVGTFDALYAHHHEAELQAQRAVLAAPVTDYEQTVFSSGYMMLGPTIHEAVNTPLLTKEQATKLLAARAAKLDKKQELDPLADLLWQEGTQIHTLGECVNDKLRIAYDRGRKAVQP